MGKRATATFKIVAWDEKPYEDLPGGGKLTHASVITSLQGDIEGEGRVEYVMTYREDGSASYVGFERVIGRLGGRSGSFVLQQIGTFQGGMATSTFIVVPHSGTGELRGLRGKGSFATGHEEPHTMALDYDFE